MLEPQTYAVLMLVGFFAMLMIGVPVAISLATVGFVFGWLGFGLLALQTVAALGRLVLNETQRREAERV